MSEPLTIELLIHADGTVNARVIPKYTSELPDGFRSGGGFAVGTGHYVYVYEEVPAPTAREVAEAVVEWDKKHYTRATCAVTQLARRWVAAGRPS